MDKLLWKQIIHDSGYHKVCIPYMVGQYYEKGIIASINSSQCIKDVLSDIIENASVGDEVAIFPCTSYNYEYIGNHKQHRSKNGSHRRTHRQ